MDYAIKVMEVNGANKNKFEVYANASLAISDDVNVLKHIVRYFSSWQHKKEQCIVMELCKQSLREYVSKIQAKSLSGVKESDIKLALRHACLGLKGLHDQNIVHLDIKPENILRGVNRNFKLGDLGMARAQPKA